MADLRAKLAGPNPNPLEELLIDRIVYCWADLYRCEADAQNRREATLATARFLQRRIDHSQARYMSAIKALASVRRISASALRRVTLSETRSVTMEAKEPGWSALASEPKQNERKPLTRE